MSRVFVLLTVGCLLMAACTPEPVKWESETRTDGPVPPGARLALSPSGAPVMAPAWTPPVLPAGTPQCAGSLVATLARGDTAYAAWWAPRADSNALLVVSRSEDGGRSWRAAEIADSTDRGRTGCGRPAPFIDADTANGYLHLSYFMVAAEGPGVFFTHSMGAGVMFHSPVPVVYGDRVSTSAVSSNGDTVAVAYLDPNTSRPQVWLALSRTTGHIFESRMPVSPESQMASRPSVVVRGHRIVVAWQEVPREGGANVMVIRTGRWK